MLSVEQHRRGSLAAGALLGVAMLVAACTSSGSLQSSQGAALVKGASSAPQSNPPAAVTVNGQASALQDQMVAVIKAVGPSIVEVETSSGLGSGVVYDAKGDIVTNAHVVDGATTFKVTTSDGKSYQGTLVGSYPADDVAVLKVTATGLTPATFGNSSKLSVGDFVLAMGNPLGLQSSVTEGIVSALSRQVSEPNGNTLPDVIQTSAAINPGNSGGALVDLSGQVVGIPTLAATDPQLGGSAPGIGFAVSSNRATLVADQLIASGKVTNSGRAYLGVEIRDDPAGAGALVASVVADGPAARAGIVAGDIITAIGASNIPDAATVGSVLASAKPGDVVKVTLLHASKASSSVSVTLGTLPG